MHDDRPRLDRRAALSVLAALAAVASATRQAHAIPTIGEKGVVTNVQAPGDVIDALQQVISGVSTVSPTQDESPPPTPHFCGWNDVETALRGIADAIHSKAEKSDDWRWNKHHQSC